MAVLQRAAASAKVSTRAKQDPSAPASPLQLKSVGGLTAEEPAPAQAPPLGSPPSLLPAAPSPEQLPPPASGRRVPSLRLAELRSPAEVAEYDAMTQRVPSTEWEALRLFFSRPAIVTSVACACTALLLRLLRHPPAAVDSLVALAVALWWVLQEWLIHAKLLHSTAEWWGTDIHVRHHNMPYHHVSIDGFKVVAPTILISFVVFRLLFREDSLFLTALATYYFMGLAYEWTHFLVHTKVPMRTYAGKIIKRAHVKHHLRDDKYWFSFTCPPLDNLMGTTPEPWQIG